MLVLLPPSETKAEGGDGPPLNLESLADPDLTETRHAVVSALVTLAEDLPTSLRLLGLSERQSGEVERNAALLSSPTMPGLRRYTGVLYDALDVGSLTPEERARADRRLAVASALLGVVRGTDWIPAYRLSGGNSLPALGTMRGVWRPVLEPVLAEADGLVIDLRSGVYAALARVPGAVTVHVLSESASGERTVVSHHNKSHKGALARALAKVPQEPRDVEDVITVAKGAGLRVERESERRLSVIVSA